MLDALTSVLIKIIELIISNRNSIEKNKSGCKGLLKLYAKLDDIIIVSEELRGRIEIFEKLVDRSEVDLILKDLYKATKKFQSQLQEISNGLGIFDELLRRKLHEILGIKYSLLRILCPDSTKINLKFNIKKFSSSSKYKQHYYYNYEELSELSSLMGLSLAELKDSSMTIDKLEKDNIVRREHIQLENFEERKKILVQTDRNITKLRNAQKVLADFIRINCKYEDIF